MPTGARVYLSKRGLGSEATCRHLLQEIKQFLDLWNAPQRRVHYSGQILFDQGDADWTLIDPKGNLATIGSQFPAIWLIINYDIQATSHEQLVEFEAKFDLHLVKGGPAQPDRFE